MVQSVVEWLFSPIVFEVGALFALTLGVTLALAASRKDVRKAHLFFAAGFALTMGRIAQFVDTLDRAPVRYLAAVFLFGAVGALWVASHDWVTNKHQPPSDEPAELQARITPYYPDRLFYVNEQIVAQLEWHLHGADVVRSPQLAGHIYVVTRDQESYRLNEASPAMQQAVIDYWKTEYAKRTATIAEGPSIYADTPGIVLIRSTVITQEIADGLQMFNHTPDRMLFVIGSARFSDASGGRHEAHTCAWLTAASESFLNPSLRWIGCPKYMDQIKLDDH